MKELDFKQPLSQEIEVLPADKPGDIKLGWTIKEYIGPEIEGEIAEHIRTMIANMKDGETLPITNYPTFYFTRDSETTGCLDDGSKTLQAIEIDGDERKAVVCICYMNKRGLFNADRNLKIGL